MEAGGHVITNTEISGFFYDGIWKRPQNRIEEDFGHIMGK